VVAKEIQGGSNMTGTDLCVNKPQSVPVIYETPCIYIWPLLLTNRHKASHVQRSTHAVLQRRTFIIQIQIVQICNLIVLTIIVQKLLLRVKL
jgi:hypothetical protein